MEIPRLVLFDGNAIIHRAYHAFEKRPLTVRKTGEVVSAVYGFDQMLLKVISELKRTFRPEFLNRLDGTMVFHALTRSQIKQIVDLELDKVRERLVEKHVTLQVTDAAKAHLSEEGYNPNFGARPLRRVVQNKIEDVLSEGILSGAFQHGYTVEVDFKDGKISMEVTARTEVEDGDVVANPEKMI